MHQWGSHEVIFFTPGWRNKKVSHCSSLVFRGNLCGLTIRKCCDVPADPEIFCRSSPRVNVYKKPWKDPPCFQWENIHYFYGHFQ